MKRRGVLCAALGCDNRSCPEWVNQVPLMSGTDKWWGLPRCDERCRACHSALTTRRGSDAVANEGFFDDILLGLGVCPLTQASGIEDRFEVDIERQRAADHCPVPIW